MLIWNVSTTWWVINSTLPGAIAAFLANSLLMCIPWLGFYNVKKRMGATAGYISLIAFWLTFEYIHLNWELSWPWLTLGNVFSVHTNWVQWYEYTGTSGGSLWVLIVNLFIFLLKKKWWSTRSVNVRLLSIIIGSIFLPLVISYFGFEFVFDKRSAGNVLVVQPNVDPYQKFEPGDEYRQLQNLISISESKMDTLTSLVVWPETAIPIPLQEDSVKDHPFLRTLRDFLHRHPHINLLTGMEEFRLFDKDHQTKYTEKYFNTGLYYEAYNAAVLLDTSETQFYHKSRLVPGVEILPSFLKFLASWFEQFGGTTGGYARQEKRTVLVCANSQYKIAPAICYESIYGEFMTGFVRNGANVICVITNDGWWGKTPGYLQHQSYARLRAIETRCSVIRSANTGISCFIDRKGNVQQELLWDVTGAIKQSVPTHDGRETFFVRHGDVLSIVAIGFSVLLALWNIFAIVMGMRHGKKSYSPK
jgi:apolipoprotein N-acyltransferase